MPNHICVTCGHQFAESTDPPPACPICEDERQFVNWDGQQWTTMDSLRDNYRNLIQTEEPGLTSVSTQPRFAIGQQALIVRSPGGNVLWDCISLLDDETVEAIEALGGLSACAISHPHLAGSIVEWSHAFGHVPIYWHADDREHVQRPDPAIVFWEGDTQAIGEGLTLIRAGGHFEGSAILHWAAGAEGRGALLVGDTMFVARDRRYVTFMYSIPNMIPLSGRAVRRIVNAVEPYPYDRIYGHFAGLVVREDARTAVARSAERYLRAITD